AHTECRSGSLLYDDTGTGAGTVCAGGSVEPGCACDDGVSGEGVSTIWGTFCRVGGRRGLGLSGPLMCVWICRSCNEDGPLDGAAAPPGPTIESNVVDGIG